MARHMYVKLSFQTATLTFTLDASHVGARIQFTLTLRPDAHFNAGRIRSAREIVRPLSTISSARLALSTRSLSASRGLASHDRLGHEGLAVRSTLPARVPINNRGHSSSMAKSLMMRISSPRVVAMRSRNFSEVRNHSAPVRVPRTPSWSASRRNPWNCLSACEDPPAG